jgi:hypothetical protein
VPLLVGDEDKEDDEADDGDDNNDNATEQTGIGMATVHTVLLMPKMKHFKILGMTTVHTVLLMPKMKAFLNHSHGYSLQCTADA